MWVDVEKSLAHNDERRDMEDGVWSQIMQIQAVIEHEPPHKGIEGEAQAAEEVRDKNDALIRLRCGDDLPWSRKPVLDVSGQVSDLPKLRNILLCDRGSHPPALKVGFGHDGRYRGLELGLRVLELEMQKGASVVEQRDRPRPLYRGGEYQASSA